MARALFPPLLITMLVFGVLFGLIIAFGEADPHAPSKWILVPVAFGYGAFIGLWPGLLLGGLRLSWALVGRWTLLPLLLIPAAVALALWLATDLLAGRVDGIEQAVRVAMDDHEWMILAATGLAHAGPVAVVIIAPLLLLDLGAIALDPGVLWAIFELLLVFALVVATAVIPTAGLSFVVLLGSYLRRLRERIEARRAAAATVPAVDATGATGPD